MPAKKSTSLLHISKTKMANTNHVAIFVELVDFWQSISIESQVSVTKHPIFSNRQIEYAHILVFLDYKNIIKETDFL